jgi:transposase
MAISKEVEAKILRYYHVEKWRVGTIARFCHVHHSVVERVLSQSGVSHQVMKKREILITPFLAFIEETLEKYPKLSASRLYEMVKSRGYPGGVDHFRHIISLYRPRPKAEAYLRLRTLPGEQAQVDWGHFGTIEIGKAKRPLMAFVMVLSFSRKIFLRFFLNSRMENFLRGHEAAFHYFKGIPRVCLYDNLKSLVLERIGDAIRFHPTLLEFSALHRFETRPVAIARGNEKGRVERAIRYIRDNFFAARLWKDIDDLNQQANVWCDGPASSRPCPEDKILSVQVAFQSEQALLLPLPDNPYPTHEREEVSVGKTPYVRFDLNDYSVPYEYVRRTLTVNATPDTVIISNGTNVIASHPRSYDKGKQIEHEQHIAELVAYKKQASLHRSQDRLIQAVPSSQKLLVQAAAFGYSLYTFVKNLNRLLDRYGAAEVEAAVLEALARNVPHHHAVRLSLEKRREERNQLPPVSLDLPDDKRVRELVVRPHQLHTYDQLQKEEKNNDNN